MKKNQKSKLLAVTVCCGVASNIVIEALETAFLVLAEEPDVKGAKLNIKSIPLKLLCNNCKKEFNTNDKVPAAWFTTCPFCKKDDGNTILGGKELYIESIEVE